MTMVAPRAVARRPTRSGRSAPYVFVAPVVALFTLSIAVPIGYAIYLSLLTVKVSAGSPCTAGSSSP